MRFQDLKREYPGKVCICKKHLHELRSRWVVSWEYLQSVDDVDAAREVLKRFDLDGVTDAVAISTSEEIVIRCSR